MVSKRQFELELEKSITESERVIHPPPLTNPKSTQDLACERFNNGKKYIDTSDPNLPLCCLRIKFEHQVEEEMLKRVETKVTCSNVNNLDLTPQHSLVEQEEMIKRLKNNRK
ncbi:unnamed protein product [Linum trigynum]|uniref:Uncharacterized protein n=1 Tax=Linum trigynum TaxID=586398 RepID=A0AAV2FM18_9ROSI